MITVAGTSDNHWDFDSRWTECNRIHDWMADDFIARLVDLVIIPGDFFERASKAVERNAVRGWLQKIAQKIPIVGARGNHDSLGDLDIFNHIAAPERIIIEEAAEVYLVKPKHLPSHPGIAVASVAWPRKTHLLARLGREVGREESEGAAREALRNIMLGLRQKLHAHPGPRILAMHAMVNGSITSTGQPLTGCDLEVSLSELAAAEPDIIVLGHVHKPQDFGEYNGIPILYCGSPYATAYGETEPKSYVLMKFNEERDADGKCLIGYERVTTPRQPMVLIESIHLPDSPTGFGDSTMLDDYEFTGADVRFRYQVDADRRDAAKIAASVLMSEMVTRGAAHIKVEEVVKEKTHARAPEVTKAVTMPEKLDILWQTQGVTISEERKARLFAKAGEIESIVRDPDSQIALVAD
jgi:DNA repair protein SbcD/Mre11